MSPAPPPAIVQTPRHGSPEVPRARQRSDRAGARATPLEERFDAAVALIGFGLGTLLLLSGIFGDAPLTHVAPVAICVFFVSAFHRKLLRWYALVATILLVILLIPIRRYQLPMELPIVLEPYRLLVGFVAASWIAAALIDPRVRLRRTGVFELPLMIFAVAVLASQLLNLDRVASVSSQVTKDTLFFVSYVIVLFLVASVITRYSEVRFLIRFLVVGATVIGLLALVESRTGANVFHQLDRVFPFLREVKEAEQLSRSSRIRAVASAQHPIALGAALALVLPIALSLAFAERKARWWLASALILLGAMGSVSRTVVVMLAGSLAIFVWTRRSQMRYVWLAMIPIMVLAHFALPGTLGAFKKSFTTEQLITKSQNSPVGSGRLATLGPALRAEFVPNPLLGEGFATRVTIPYRNTPANSPILDNQWLGVLLETGIVGAAALVWLFGRTIRIYGRTGKEDDSDLGWLLCGVTAAVASFAVAMFTFDVFSFIQVTFLLFIILGLGSSIMRLLSEGNSSPQAGLASVD